MSSAGKAPANSTPNQDGWGSVPMAPGAAKRRHTGVCSFSPSPSPRLPPAPPTITPPTIGSESSTPILHEAPSSLRGSMKTTYTQSRLHLATTSAPAAAVPTPATFSRKFIAFPKDEFKNYLQGHKTNGIPSSSCLTVPVVSPGTQRLNFSTPQSFVTIIVDTGAAQQTFVVHKAVISHYSPFFETAFNSSFIEGSTQTMTLEDVCAPNFGLFVNWLYTQSLELPSGCPPLLIQYAALYVIAQRFMVPLLPSKLLEIIQDCSPDKNVGGGNTLKDFQAYAYAASSAEWKDSPLKKLAILKSAGIFKSKNMREMIDEMPQDMFADMVQAMTDGCSTCSGWSVATFAGIFLMTNCKPTRKHSW